MRHLAPFVLCLCIVVHPWGHRAAAGDDAPCALSTQALLDNVQFASPTKSAGILIAQAPPAGARIVYTGHCNGEAKDTQGNVKICAKGFRAVCWETGRNTTLCGCEPDPQCK
jgi:hypothetical protein